MLQVVPGVLGSSTGRRGVIFKPPTEQQYSLAAQSIIDAMHAEAARRGSPFVGPQDLFLALFESKTTRAGGLLRSSLTSRYPTLDSSTLRTILSLQRLPDKTNLSVAPVPQNGDVTGKAKKLLPEAVERTIDQAKLLAKQQQGENIVSDLDLLNAAFKPGGCCATTQIGTFLAKPPFMGVVSDIRGLFAPKGSAN